MKGSRLSPAFARSASMIAFAAALGAPSIAAAQDVPPAQDAQAMQGQLETPASTGEETSGDDIVVTGIRASLDRAISIKRNSAGVVDAISAEDIGKFPDTNLAESLQRITGVSIDRRNGEGSQVTVRGFGPGYNLVTLNGRTLASSSIQVVGGDGNADGATGTSRSFDFNNLASEGVRTLEVYKTGRAAIPSGGIGAAINVVTRRPLDTSETGLNGSIGVKALYDTSVEDCLDCGDKVTPEATGFLSWANPEQTFGVGLFGSYQKRNFSAASASSNAWNIVPYSTFLGYTNAQTRITNAPTDPNALVSLPNDSRLHFSESNRERINGQAVVQFRPTENLTLTADALFAQNKQRERRSDSSNWFNRPFDEVIFDGDPLINTAVYLHETLGASPKDGPGSEQQYRAQKDRLQDYGLNVRWDYLDNFTLSVDGHYSKATTSPDNPQGASSTLVGMAPKVIADHSVDYSGGIPVMQYNIDDSATGNGNGTIDVGDLGSQVARTIANTQRQTMKEIRSDASWDFGEGARLDFGSNYRSSRMRQTTNSTQQTLGDWGIVFPGDVERIAPGLTETFCLACKFDKYDAMATGEVQTAFRANAADLYDALSAYYAQQRDPVTGQLTNQVASSGFANNLVEEKIISGYGQVSWKGEFAGMPAGLVAGVRYERTRVRSTSLQAVPTAIRWDADNDFFTVIDTSNVQALTQTAKYDNLLPAMDFQLEIQPNLISRFSFSKTIARTGYGDLFTATGVAAPGRPTFLGGVPSGNTGNPGLVPLESDNIDLTLEWYYKPSSFISVGFFDKRVRNFVGIGQSTQELFGLRNPTSGEPGTRSGIAREELQRLGADLSDVNLFTMTALLDQRGSIGAASAEFQANYNAGARLLNQQYVDSILAQYNITGNAADPLYQFSVARPINSRDAEIYGFEIAGQHFFGDTGIGIAAAYTLVRGDVGVDVNADPSVDQFALLGLSDTANATLIYDKNGISARLAYNWRDDFLSQINRDSFRNPAFTKPFGQLDLNISYDVTPRLAISFEGINLNEETVRTYGRRTNNLWFAQELKRRFLLGARYRL